MNKVRLADGLAHQHALLKGRRELLQAAVDRLAAEMEPLAAELEKIDAEMEIVNKAILLFDPEVTLGHIKPRIPKPRITPLKYGTPLRHAFKLMRDSEETFSTAEIMDDLLKSVGQEGVDQKVRESIRRSINQGLQSREKKGWVRSLQDDEGNRRWQFVPKAIG